MAPPLDPFALSLSRGCDCRCSQLRCRCGCAAADATAWRQMEGFRPLHDEQEGRFRTASLHPPAAPNDHHHGQHLSVLPAFRVATKSHPCALVAFVAVRATQPLRPTGRALFWAVWVVIKGEKCDIGADGRVGVPVNPWHVLRVCPNAPANRRRSRPG